jgi:hypothetical protein
VVRQSFGMLQLFKGQSRAPFPAWARRADNAFFVTMALLQLWTFSGGLATGEYVFAPDVVSVLLLVVAAGMLAAVIAGFAKAAPGAAPGSLWVPGTYFTLQAAGAALAAWNSALYPATLAMHYIEYHVMIFPRLFTAPGNGSSRADRAAAWIRRHKLAFYLVLLLLSVFVARDTLWPLVEQRLGTRADLWFLFNVLNGIFVTHYFLEAFIWKFRNPYFRESLGQVYFARAERAQVS